MGRDFQAALKPELFVTGEAQPRVEAFLGKLGRQYRVIGSIAELPASEERRVVFDVNKGRFLSACPGTPKYVCCGYYVLAPVENCPFSCTYCILNAYFKSRDITVHANTDKMIAELGAAAGKGKIKRFGTGEFSDSLSMPETLYYLDPLLAFFRSRPELTLELKTKNHRIPPVFLDHASGNVIFSWSVNSARVTEQEEGGTSSLKQRLETAAALADRGYRLSFHFDPVISYPGWEDDYRETVRLIGKTVPARSLAWISLGTLRFIPELKDIAMKLYPDTAIFSREFILGQDGKKRYFRKERVEIYRALAAMIADHIPGAFLYLCMENQDVWQEVFGIRMTTRKLKELMDGRAAG